MRLALVMILALAGSACGVASPAGGIANYDALARAQSGCAAKGGTMVLRDGGDSQYLEDYACKRK